MLIGKRNTPNLPFLWKWIAVVLLSLQIYWILVTVSLYFHISFNLYFHSSWWREQEWNRNEVILFSVSITWFPLEIHFTNLLEPIIPNCTASKSSSSHPLPFNFVIIWKSFTCFFPKTLLFPKMCPPGHCFFCIHLWLHLSLCLSLS